MSNDVRTLLQSIGQHPFTYHELRAQDRMQEALGRWNLLQSCARTLRSPEHRPEPHPRPAPAHSEFRVAVASPSGGVGRTTLTANLCLALNRLGEKCLALELDPQNSLRFHFSSAASTADETGVQRSGGAAFLPFGEMSTARLEALERAMGEPGLGLSEQFRPVIRSEYTFVLADLPAGRSPWLAPALRWADLTMVVLSAEALSCALIPALERWLDEGGGRATSTLYLINRFDSRHPLERDAASAVRGLLKERCLASAIPFDPVVAEALAHGQGVAQYAPHSQVVEELSGVAAQLIQCRAQQRQQ